MNSFDRFQDNIYALEQYRQSTGTPKAEILDSPDCAEVISAMETLVIECPEIVDFYARIIKNYKPKQPEKIKEELDVIDQRLSLMINDGLYTPKQEEKLKTKIKTGEIAVDEAQVFFKLFKDSIPKERRPKVARSAQKPVAKPNKPRQARQINVAITEHGGVSVNDRYLRTLTPTQKLVILSGLYAQQGFRNVDIYSSPEFREIIDESHTDEELPGIYADELANLRELLDQEGLGRLLDPNKKKGQRKHDIVAHSVVDYRVSARPKDQPLPAPTKKTHYKLEDSSEPTFPLRIDNEQRHIELSADTTQQAHQILSNLLASKGSVFRSELIEAVIEQLDIDLQTAKHTISRIYADERAKPNPTFGQVKAGGRRFVATHQETKKDEQEYPFGTYFGGSREEFHRRFGEVKGVAPDFVNYVRGVIKLGGVEQGLLCYFAETKERKAVSAKSVVTALGKQGIVATSAELRVACKVINSLAGRIFVQTLKPATRYSAVKGPRVQMVGSFMEVNEPSR